MQKQLLLLILILTSSCAPVIGAATTAARSSLKRKAYDPSELEGYVHHYTTLTDDQKRIAWLNSYIFKHELPVDNASEVNDSVQAVAQILYVLFKRDETIFSQLNIPGNWLTAVLRLQPELGQVLGKATSGVDGTVLAAVNNPHYVQLVTLARAYAPECWSGIMPRRTVEDAAEKFEVPAAKFPTVFAQLKSVPIQNKVEHKLAWSMLARKLQLFDMKREADAMGKNAER
jgi:hypothetical protein